MKQLKVAMLAIAFMTMANMAQARDVFVNGYYRSNGTYVQPHVRSSPDNVRWNNYGPTRSSEERMNPTTRDSDHDGIPNYQDHDDNNNGVQDDQEPRGSQY
jgi:hypothetical protein